MPNHGGEDCRWAIGGLGGPGCWFPRFPSWNFGCAVGTKMRGRVQVSYLFVFSSWCWGVLPRHQIRWFFGAGDSGWSPRCRLFPFCCGSRMRVVFKAGGWKKSNPLLKFLLHYYNIGTGIENTLKIGEAGRHKTLMRWLVWRCEHQKRKKVSISMLLHYLSVLYMGKDIKMLHACSWSCSQLQSSGTVQHFQVDRQSSPIFSFLIDLIQHSIQPPL